MAAHRCFVCDEDNPERIVTYTSEDCIFEFNDRFEGPKGRAHGGIAIGALTCPALQLAARDGMRHPAALSVTGRLNLPVPLAKPIRAKAIREEDSYQVELHDEASVILKGNVEVVDRKTAPNTEIQKPPSKHLEVLNALAELVSTDITGLTLPVQLRQFVKEAGLPWIGGRCFGCSEADNAMKLHHRLARSGDTWTRWEIEPTFTEGDGRLATSIIVAAIDCATMYTLMAWDQDFVRQLLREKKFWMTGTYGVRFLIVPPVKNKEDYIVTARFLGIEGRKLFAISALLDSKGKVYAIGEATGIIFDFYSD
jgi:hypothetical protein